MQHVNLLLGEWEGLSLTLVSWVSYNNIGVTATLLGGSHKFTCLFFAILAVKLSSDLELRISSKVIIRCKYLSMPF